MSKGLRRILIYTAGVLFVLLGLAGLVLPFLQGILFLAIGVILLSMVSPAIRSFTEKHTRKFPRVHEAVQRIEKKIADIIGQP